MPTRAQTPPPPYRRSPQGVQLPASQLQSKSTGRIPRPYEFGGNLGTCFWTIFIPVAIFYSYGTNSVNNGVVKVPDLDFWNTLIWELPAGIAIRPTLDGLAILSSWVFLQFLFQQFMPGPIEYGTVLKNGGRLPYKLNGWKSWVATWAIVIALVLTGHLDPTIGFRHFGSLMMWANIGSFVGALYLYIHFGVLWRRWRSSPEFEADWGMFRWSDFFHDYWMGTARNPRIFHFLGYPFDLKFFFEARPGLILWVLINWSNVAAMYYGCQVGEHDVTCQDDGDWSRVPLAMPIIAFGHTLYISDYFWHEVAILTTTDIRHEPFGFMLLWGDMGFLPWMYTNSFTGYLAHLQPPYQGNLALDVCCFVVQVLAVLMFRLTNIQKHDFRTYATANNNDPTGFKIWGKDVNYIRTREGSLLLTSGFWGLCRHPNYAPDMIMAMCWFINCAAHSNVPIVPFGYVIYFWSMDIHRFFRDEERCAKKYKDDWWRYTKAVPSRLIPGIW